MSAYALHVIERHEPNRFDLLVFVDDVHGPADPGQLPQRNTPIT
jgi:hypothetical protein